MTIDNRDNKADLFGTYSLDGPFKLVPIKKKKNVKKNSVTDLKLTKKLSVTKYSFLHK